MPRKNVARRLFNKVLGYLFDSPSERSLRKTADRIVSKLEEDLNPEIVQRAKDWLDHNATKSEARSVIRKLLEVAGTEQTIKWLLELARRHPECADDVLDKLLYYTTTEAVMKAVAERLDTPGTSLTQSFILRKYLREAPLDEAKKRSLQWIRDHPEGDGVSDSFSFLLANFPEERPRARTWVMAHEHSRERLNVLAALIKIGDQEALEMAKANLMALRNDSVFDSRTRLMFFRDIFRAIAHSFPDQFQSPWMQDWLNQNAKNEGLSWLGDSILTGTSRDTDQVIAFAKQILKLQPDAMASRHVVTGLMQARGDAESIEMGKKLLRKNPNDTSLMCVLLRTAHDDETVAAAKRWLRNHSKDPDAVFILNHLSDHSSDDEIVKHLKTWLKANPNNTNLPGALSYYTRARHDQELIDLTKQYLEKELLHEQFVWLIRSLLKITAEDSFAITKAKTWLNNNQTYSECGTESSLINEGKVLSALLDAQPDDEVIEKSKLWLSKNPSGSNERISTRIREKLAKHGHIIS